jgi:D-tyrosyl-tRNA(Tyr) deacylase
MRAVIQRVSRAEVKVQPKSGAATGAAAAAAVARTQGEAAPSSAPAVGEVLGRIGAGFCVLLGIGHGDTKESAQWLADKVAGLRIFADPPAADGTPAQKDMNRSLRDIGGALLVVSQFTLYADASRGRRPSFTGAMPPAEAVPLYEYFVQLLREAGFEVQTGRFGENMAVELVNDGPVTIWLDSAEATAGKKAATPSSGST